MLRYQHSVNNSSRQGRPCCTPAAVRPPAVALVQPHQQAMRYVSVAQGFSSCSRPIGLGRLAMSASRAHKLVYDSDDYEWEEYNKGWKNGVGAVEVAAASGVVVEAAGVTACADAVHSSTSSKAASSQRNQQHARHQQRPEAQSQRWQQQQEQEAAASAEYSYAGGGIVGVFVAGWMAVIALVLRVLQPVVSLALMLTQPLTNVSPARAKHQMQKLAAELPEGFWAKLHFLWELPVVKSIRITLSVANWGVRLPAIAALLLTQGSLLASQVSLPMLAPLLLGTGMMMNSIKKNASFIFPRVGLLVVLLWLLWFVNSVIQNTWLVLRNQGRIDARTMSGARMITECSSLLLAGILVLSALGININALLLPTGVVLAIASKDLLQNLIAGFYLVLVQPFRLGDKVAVSCSLPSGAAQGSNSKIGSSGLAAAAGAGSSGSGGALSAMQGWFEGVCEKVDLRYTVLRDGRRRLMVPNTAFVSREFLVYDDGPTDVTRPGSTAGSAANSRSSSPWPGSNSSSNHHDGEPASRQPTIREGHMTTELPPLAPPIFPGMTLVGPPPGYGQMQYAPQGYAAVPYPAGYGQVQHMQDQQQENQDNQGQYEQDQQQQQSQQGEQGAGSADGSSSSGHGQQRQGSSSSDSGNKAGRAKVAKGPPGYLPQGYTAGQYLGIPVYWTLPGMLGPWTGGTGSGQQQQAQQQQRQQQQQQQQQYFEQQYFDYFEPAGMHQPVPPHHPPPSPSSQHNTQNPWQQQAQLHWQQQQQAQQQQQQAPQTQQQQQRAASRQSAGPSVHQGRHRAPQRHPSHSGSGRSSTSGNENASHSSRSSSSGEHMRPSSQGSNGKSNGSRQVVDGSSTIRGHLGVRAEQQQQQEQRPDYHQNAMHVAGLGVGGYTFWGGAVPPGALHQQLQYQQYSPAVQLQFMPVQQYQPPLEHDVAHATAAGAAKPYSYMHQYGSNGNAHQPHRQEQQHQQSSSDSTAAAAVGPGPDTLSAGARASPIDQLAAAHSLEPAAAAAASAGGVAGLSLQPITGGVTAAASAAAVAGSAATSIPAQQFGAMATKAAGQMWSPIVGLCEEIGQGLNEL